MRFLDRIRFQRAPKTTHELDSLALRELARRSADLSQSRHIVHFLYFPAEESARAAADAIAESWAAAVEPPGETIAEWCVRADGHRTVGPETIAAFRAWFEDIAAEHGGEYDGWEAAAKP